MSPSHSKTQNTYTEEFELVIEEIERLLDEDGQNEIIIDHDRITAGSILNERLLDIYENGSIGIKDFFLILRYTYKYYIPGKALKIPVQDGIPYGLGFEIELPKQFTRSDFDYLVDQIWNDVHSYSWEEIWKQISPRISSLNKTLHIIKDILFLIVMKIYGNLFEPGLKRSYSINNNTLGVRFYESRDYNYIDISDGVKNYTYTIEETKKITRHLDSVGLGNDS